MHLWLMSWIERARDGFWLIPSLMVAAAAVLGVAVPWIDANVLRDGFPTQVMFVYDAGAEGARSLLAAVASSSITVGATVFSITIATLALTSQQYGPRLLRTFTTDRGVQFSLGTFLATFIYPLLVLRVVRGEGDNPLVPHLSVTVAVILAVMAVGVLIYFIDHVATMIRAPQIIHLVGQELDHVLDERIPADGSGGDSDEECDQILDPELPGPDDPAAVTAARSGYIELVDESELVELAEKQDLVLRMAVGAGTYVHEGTPLLLAKPRVQLSDEEREHLADAFHISSHRTVTQDIIYGFNQLVELSLRAISPGINDPFTAQTCIDRITSALCRIVDRPFPDPRLRDKNGHVRLLVLRPNFHYLVEISFAPIRRYSRKDAALLARLLMGLSDIARRTPLNRPTRRQTLRTQADAILREIDSLDPTDARMIDREAARFNTAFFHEPPPEH